MSNIVELVPCETVRLDPGRLRLLYRKLGEVDADNFVCHSIEEIALRLAHCESLWRRGKWTELHQCAKSVMELSGRVGMTSMAIVASDLIGAIRACDEPAVGATLWRLGRIGERSLIEVWDIQDLIV